MANRRSPYRQFALFVLWPATGVAIGQFLRHWQMPDSCMDMGGSFNYVSWLCDLHENHQFVSVPFHHFYTFWLSLGLFATAALLTFITRSPVAADG